MALTLAAAVAAKLSVVTNDYQEPNCDILGDAERETTIIGRKRE